MQGKQEDKYGVEAIGVKTLAPDDLKANPHNPRALFDRQDMHVLRQSIARVGILTSSGVGRLG